ncbi:MAG: hypothetical protein A3G34_01165 [Candidatus Lindowbacteria bacterium RIFCSPLOWO2_12_FULL_62_27]|nr:MAG: hypothetical protein A3G34_01165 [Candidatus Lindowbacteria bacterium RIFCSPLOWO2_12_FULL_62_27]OGH55784.1 MAG: hypothetical protein A3I06_13250 [Candidatus Lindowbacteria bacterium RIFCSPLOWO2_02_FULL_62_12]
MPDPWGEERRRKITRWTTAASLVGVLIVLFPFYIHALIGIFDMQIVSTVDGRPIRYRHIAVSLGEVSMLTARTGKSDAVHEKKRELEYAALVRLEVSILRKNLRDAGDTIDADMSDEQLFDWARSMGRIVRVEAWKRPR